MGNAQSAAHLRRRPLSACWTVLVVLGLVLVGYGSRPALAQDDGGGKFVDATQCGDALRLSIETQSDDGACQLWKVVPDADGWSRLQLKRTGKFLDAKYCTDDVSLAQNSNYEGGACQLWRFEPVADGWARLQLKATGKYLETVQCGDDVHLNEMAAAQDPACQLWRLVPSPAGDGWSRLQVRFVGGSSAPVAAMTGDEFADEGQTYGWFDDGWSGPGWYILGYETTPGYGYGGAEGWHGWHHRGNHAHVEQRAFHGEHNGGHGGQHGGGEHFGGGQHGGGEHFGGGEHHGGAEHFGGGQHGGGGQHFGGGVHHTGGGGGGLVRHVGGGGGGGHPHFGGGGGGVHVNVVHAGGGGGGGKHRSDIRLKHDIVLLGRLDNGLGLYRFAYKGSNKQYVGVMAQEVAAVMPEAVERDRTGYLLVDYDRLGLRMQSWKDWVAAGARVPMRTSSY
jgi:hypothetical protein